MGTQIHAEPNYRRVVGYADRRHGPVSEAHVGGTRGGGRARTRRSDTTTASVTERRGGIPDSGGAAWDCGRPGAGATVPRGLFPGPKWYRWWDFGGGTWSDLGSH
jgi:hypothetical protein